MLLLWLGYTLAISTSSWRVDHAASRICQRSKGSDASSALALLCKRDLRYQDIWILGLDLLGEYAFTTFMMHSRAEVITMVGHKVEVFLDDRDASRFEIVNNAKDDEYDLEKGCQGLTKNDWFLDLGGHIGIVAMSVQLLSPVANVLTVEPSPWNYVLLRLNLIHNSWARRVVALRAAIGHAAGPAILQGIHPTQSSWSSGGVGSPMLQGRGVFYNVSVVSLGELMKSYKIEHVAMMKLDCEGCEWRVGLEWQQEDLWRKINMLVGELHLHGFCHHNLQLIEKFPRLSDKGLLDMLIPIRCKPDGLSADQAMQVWRELCKTSDNRMYGADCRKPLSERYLQRLLAFDSHFEKMAATKAHTKTYGSGFWIQSAPPADCEHFEGNYEDSGGGTVQIAQSACRILAENPMQKWKTSGFAVKDKLQLWTLEGYLHEGLLSWSNGAIWTRMPR